jgi:hypothetical protein
LKIIAQGRQKRKGKGHGCSAKNYAQENTGRGLRVAVYKKAQGLSSKNRRKLSLKGSGQEGKQLACMAFADDLVLLSDNELHITPMSGGRTALPTPVSCVVYSRRPDP